MINHLRRLPLSGTMNTRDLGGYPCAGGATRWGVFLRSDNPGRLSRADLALLREYGVSAVVDLRRSDEAAQDPSSLCSGEGFAVHCISMNDDIDSINFEGDLPGSMAGLYISLLDNNQPAIAAIMGVLAAAEAGALFHCAVGKDRTGVIAMLLLKLAGVANEDVVADYAVTDIYRSEMLQKQQLAFAGISIPGFVLRSKPASMYRVLQHLAQRYGTAEEYLLGIGVPATALEAIRRKFVDPA